NAGRRRGRQRDVVVVGGQQNRTRVGRRYVDTHLLERAADLVGVQKIGGREQAVAAAADPFQRQSGGLRLLQQLGNAGARQPHRRGEVFAGVESAVRKLAQERESERSEHKPTSIRSSTES